MEELIAQLNSSQNKVSFLLEKIGEGVITSASFDRIIKDCFSDAEREEAIRRVDELGEDYKDYFVREIFKVISDKELAYGLIKDCKDIKRVHKNDVDNLVRTLDDNKKIDLLKDENFVKVFDYNKFDFKKVILSLSNEMQLELLSNTELLESLKCGNFERIQDENGMYKSVFKELVPISREIGTIAEILSDVKCPDEQRLELASKNGITGYQLEAVCERLSEDKVIDIVLNGTEGLEVGERRTLMRSLSAEGLFNVLSNNFDKLYDTFGDYLYNAIGTFNIENLEFLFSKIDELNINESTKRKLVGCLSRSNSEEIDVSFIPERLREIAKLERSDSIAEYGIRYDEKLDPSIYKDLDQFIVVNPMYFNDAQKRQLIDLITICPDIRLRDDIGISSSTPQEYISGEIWINEVLSGVKPEWSDIQKIAYIDNKVGNKLSYSPEFDLDGFDAAGARSLWKIIDSGYGVCNGVAQVEKYLLDSLGIESELISTGRHAFLKLKGLDVPTKDGMMHGNTIIDPTWNLSLQKFGARPNDFLLSYEDIRKHDILLDGTDRGSHRNDEKLSDCTLSISDEALREAYRSLGLTKNGTTNFPIGNLIDKIHEEDKSLSLEQRIERRFSLLQQYRPDFAKFIDSTQFILSRVVIPEKELEYDKAIIDKVHRKDDEGKKAALYTYVKEGEKEFFYIAERDAEGFTKMSREEFEQTYKMFDKDLEKTNGKNRWDIGIQKEKDINAISGRGEIEADKGDREE